MALIVWAAPLKWNCYHLGLFYSELRGSPVISTEHAISENLGNANDSCTRNLVL